jgi:hypothetical protein
MSTRYKCLIFLDNWKKAKGFFSACISPIRTSEPGSEPPSEPRPGGEGTTGPLVYPGQGLSGGAGLARPNLGRGRSERARALAETAELRSLRVNPSNISS